MGFKWHFSGGPNSGEVAEGKSAPSVIVGDATGFYRLKDIKGKTAHYVWRPHQARLEGACDGFGG